MARPVVVFCDLDGTLVLDNSFHVFIAALWSAAGPAGRLRIGGILALRALGRVGGGHAGMKRRLLGWVRQQPQAWQDAVVAATVARLRGTLSQPVIGMLEAWRAQGGRIILATAAPGLYAVAVARLIGAEACLATEWGPDGLTELLGEAKARRCVAWLKAATEHQPEVVVITDHADDLPLMRMADRVVIQAGRARFDGIVAALGRDDAVWIDPEGAQEGGGHWLWFDDRPVGPLDRWEVRTLVSKHRHARIYAGAAGWLRIGPGQGLARAVLRRDCPSPPTSARRLGFALRRRVQRDWLGVFH